MVTNKPRLLPKDEFRKNAVLFALSIMLFIAVLTYAVHETTKATVTVSIDGEETTVHTHASTVAQLIKEQDRDVKDYDRIKPSLNADIVGNMDITMDLAKQVNVTIDGEKKPVWTTAENVEQLMDELHIDYKEHDQVEPALNKEISENMNIVYESAFQVTLISDGEEEKKWTTSTTVANFLENENITLNELDRVEPSLRAKVDEETDVRVVRVEKVTDVVEEAVAYGTVTRKDNKLADGQES